MKKIFLLLITTVLVINTAYGQSDWINYKIDGKFSVKMPLEPQDVQGNKIATDKDNLVYIITVVDLVKVAGIDSATLAPMAPTQEFAESIKSGMLGQMPGFTLGEITTGKWKGLNCYHVDGENVEKKVKTYSFMVLMGSQFYSLSTVVPDGKNAKAKDDFFDSLALN